MAIRTAELQAEPLQIPPPANQVFAAVTSSPNGDRVAAIVVPQDTAPASLDRRGSLVVFDPSGKPLRNWSNIVSLPAAAATPGGGGTTGIVSQPRIRAEWASQGDQILVSSGTNELVSVPLAGDPIQIPVPDGITSIDDAQWSPRGDVVALLARGGDGPAGVQLFTPNAEPSDLRQVIPPNEGTIPFPTIERFAWLPDGSGIVYILADEQSGTPSDGQLFLLDLTSSSHRLIATPGQGGPSASIITFSISPDGKAVAYVIAIADGGQWMFHSLWMRSLRDSRVLRLQVGDVLAVNALWWSSRGLLWGQAVATNGSGVSEGFVLQESSSEPTELFRIVVVPGSSATPTPVPAGTPTG